MSVTLRRFDPSTLVRNAPIALPQVLGLLALVTLSAAEGGYPISDWAPAAVLIELLLVVALAALPVRRRAPGSRAAILLVTGFAIWSGLSILWADDRGAAADATTRTALLAATFVLCARWRHAPRASSVIITLLTGGLGIIAWGVLIRLHGATDLDPWFLYDRLLEPIGYVNAGAAFFGVTAFLGVGLLGGNLPAPHRLVGALTSVPAAALSLLCLSRGGLIAAALVVILMLAFLPGRARNGAAVVIVGVGMLVALQGLLDVGNAVRYDADAVTVLRSAIVKVFVGTAITTLITWVWIGAEARVAPGDPVRARASRIGAGLIALFAIVAVVAAVSEKGPVTVHKIRHAVDTITRPYSEQPASESRLTAGLNSGRWDFWTVAWDQFKAHPILGAGADNYRQDYLVEGKSFENPSYPHSLELRALGQLGIIGSALLLGWILVVLVAIRRLAAGRDPAGRAVAVAAAGAFGMWLIHGSGDWLLEYGGFSAIVAA
ncbi:MAG: O-antigen ligase family protein, partial [Solirubrobacteraceae bacterium]|nr:O-antigen ligase family protein [Patulibacter sp.]